MFHALSLSLNIFRGMVFYDVNVGKSAARRVEVWEAVIDSRGGRFSLVLMIDWCVC